MSMYASFFKRPFDLIISSFLILLLFPFIVLTALILGLHFKGNPLFFQRRIGLAEKGFTIIKFKTMRDTGYGASDEDRTTAFGNWLRKIRWDESPQLWNIIMGDMSLVGPRPLLPEYLPLYSALARKRHLVKPGIMGLAQLYGASSLSWDRRFKFDRLYFQNVSLLLDLWICWKSLHFFFREKVESNIGPYQG